jgi:adenylyl cyclase-associated protein
MSRIYNTNKSVNTVNVTTGASTPPPPPQSSSSSISGNTNVNNLTKLYVYNGNNNNKETSASSLSSSSSSSSPHSPTYTLNKINANESTASPHHYNTNSIANNKSEDTSKMSQAELSNLINRLEKVTGRLEIVVNNKSAPVTNGHTNGVTTNGSANESFDDLPSIVAFDELFREKFVPFKQLSAIIGNDVQSIVDLVEKVFKLERSFLIEAARSVQPGKDVLLKFFQQFSKQIEEVQSFRESKRTSQLFNHLSGISESIGAFGWIAIQPAPSPYVKEMSDAAQFYTNRVLKDYKEKDQNHSNWVKLWLQLLNELQAYVKQHHTTGVSWNSSRKSATFDPSRVSVNQTGVGAAVAAPAPSAGGPPMPPPPPPLLNLADLLADTSSSNPSSVRSAGPSSDALFAEINKGGAITSHLKKVNDDQKTHKNPNLRAGAVVPATSSISVASSKVSNTSQVSQKTPVFELVDKKWKVEFQNNRSDLVIDQTDLKHTVYIYQCKECTITVKGKVNSILIDSCNRVGLLFDDVLSTVEFINSKSSQMQVLGRVPTVAIEKTDGCQIYLSRKSLDTEIISSKSSAMNVLVPNENDDDFSEEPIPEQFKTVINQKNRKLTTIATETA